MENQRPLPDGRVIIGRRFAYTIQHVLGRGGFGITYAAWADPAPGGSGGGPVAVKEFFPAADCERAADDTLLTSSPARARVDAAKTDFLAEARRLQSLSGKNHNIVKVSEVFEANGTAYYVMERLGGSLKDMVGRLGRMQEKTMLETMTPVIKAVAFLHENRIMHLDIKPANILSGPNGPTLIDFGQSKHYDDSGMVTRTVAAAGLSDGYAPLEQYAGITSFSPTADVYALGATMLFCLTGRRPDRANDIDLIAVEKELNSLGVTGPASDAILKALSPMPSSRPANAGELLKMLDEDPTRIIVKPSEKPSRLKSAPLIAIILLALALAVALAFYFIDSEKKQPEPVSAPQISDSPDNSSFRSAPAIEEAEEVKVPVAETEEPVMTTSRFTGYFTDSNGRWPVTLTFTTDNAGRWGSCTYVNETYNVTLKMTGHGSDYNYTFTTSDKGADLRIHISYDGEGVWSGTATSGSKTLEAVFYE